MQKILITTKKNKGKILFSELKGIYKSWKIYNNLNTLQKAGFIRCEKTYDKKKYVSLTIDGHILTHYLYNIKEVENNESKGN